MGLSALAKGWQVTGVVAFALFMDYLIYGLVVPLTLYSPAGITGEEELGLLYAGYALGVLCATPLFGYFGARIGLKRTMICGVALSAAATMLFWLAPDFALMFLARLLQGGAAAGTWTAGLSLIAAHHVERRVEMMGYVLIGSTAGSILGDVAGGSLQQIGGDQLPFLVAGGLVAIDAVLRVFVLPSDPIGRPALVGVGALLTDKSVLLSAAAVGLAALGWSVVDSLLPARLAHAAVAPAMIGLIFIAAAIVLWGLRPAGRMGVGALPVAEGHGRRDAGHGRSAAARGHRSRQHRGRRRRLRRQPVLRLHAGSDHGRVRKRRRSAPDDRLSGRLRRLQRRLRGRHGGGRCGGAGGGDAAGLLCVGAVLILAAPFLWLQAQAAAPGRSP
jgi:MFS family permease